MRDWQAMVNEKLIGLGLPPTQHQETVRELAAHLEDRCEEGRAHGLSDFDACELALNEVADWRRLAREIYRAKQQEETMKNRTWNLWLPGLLTGLLAMSSLSVFTREAFKSRDITVVPTGWLELPTLWLFMLPVFGALGAYLSCRAHGRRMTRLATALFPSIVIFMLLCGDVAINVVDPQKRTLNVFANLLSGHLSLPIGFAHSTFNWVVLPSAALLLGALPFVRGSQLREEKQAQ